MSNFRGLDGALILGGALNKVPITRGTLVATDATMDIDRGGLLGIVAVGDLFTIPTETGTPTHTVTGSTFRVVIASVVSAITFTPAIATGGVANNSTVLFSSNSTGEITAWDLTADMVMLDDTVKGDTHKTFKGGVVQWSGTASGLLDYLDTQQAALIDEIATGTPDGTVAALMFQVETSDTSHKTWYGAVELSNFVTTSPAGDTGIVPVTFNFQGSGQVLPDWN